jgi:hypothetical protein
MRIVRGMFSRGLLMKIWQGRGCCSSQREGGYYDSWIHSFIWCIILLGAVLYSTI